MRQGDTWRPQQRITASDGAAGDLFGYTVAMQGDTLVVGAVLEGEVGARSGAAYVYTRRDGRWTEQQKLKAREPHVGSQFGAALALDGDTLIASAAEDASQARSGGLVYVFGRQNGRFAEQQLLQPMSPSDGALYGYSLALQGNRLIVGAPRVNLVTWPETTNGTVYAYQRSGTMFQQTAALEAPVPAPSDYFGSALAIQGDALLIASNGESSGAKRAGAAYLYVSKEGGWELSTTLTASNPDALDAFGTTVAMSEEIVAVGTMFEDGSGAGVNPSRDDNQAQDSGAVYVFR